MRKMIYCIIIICMCIFPSICNANQFIRIYINQNNEILLNTTYLIKVYLDNTSIVFVCTGEVKNISIKYDTIDNAEKAFSALFKELNEVQNEN